MSGPACIRQGQPPAPCLVCACEFNPRRLLMATSTVPKPRRFRFSGTHASINIQQQASFDDVYLRYLTDVHKGVLQAFMLPPNDLKISAGGSLEIIRGVDYQWDRMFAYDLTPRRRGTHDWSW